jgi:hypothetical protein
LNSNRNLLWLRWIFANGLAELLGLGATFAAIGLLVSRLDTQSVTGVLLSFALTVASGAIEATLVGLMQWWAMHPAVPMIGRLSWWRATLIGALMGYVLGYLPSTLMSLGASAEQVATVEPPQWVTLLLAAGLGVVAGAVLSFAQWLVLRGKVKHAGLWLPANMLAWACGMPVIFWGMDLAFKQEQLWQSVAVVGGALLITGVVVGAIHGRFLVSMAGE